MTVGREHKRKRAAPRWGAEGTRRGAGSSRWLGEGARVAMEGKGACLVLERRALPQKALVRDMALGLHAGTEGRQQRRRLRWMAPGMAHGRPG